MRKKERGGRRGERGGNPVRKEERGGGRGERGGKNQGTRDFSGFAGREVESPSGVWHPEVPVASVGHAAWLCISAKRRTETV